MYHVLVLAGSRATPEPFVSAEGKTLKATLDIAGQPMLSHVLSALRRWPKAKSITISLPQNAPLADEAPQLAADIESSGAAVVPTSSSPCKSVQLALQGFKTALANGEPVLIVTGDAPLLTPEILDEFTAQNDPKKDFITGIAKVETVERAYPEVRRTRIKLQDGHIGGCNLFILNNREAEKVIQFWRRFENNRKKPWRLAASFWMMALYLSGLLDTKRALRGLEKQIGCRLGFALMANPHAAIDVDKPKDLSLVRRIFKKEKARH